MRKQPKSLGLSIDWTRESATCDPSDVSPNHRLFLCGACWRKGWRIKTTGVVNWDPIDQSGLANE
ncbi:MAG: hypothetical protein IPI17_16960 [Nitrosomonas sp.]|nr:hypothetical protein [Nitrosomonas sp.]